MPLLLKQVFDNCKTIISEVKGYKKLKPKVRGGVRDIFIFSLIGNTVPFKL